MKIKLNHALFIAPMLWGVDAFAGGGGGEEVVGETVKKVLDLSLSMVTASPFAATGAFLFKVLLLILITWKGLKLMLDTSAVNQIIAELVNIILIAGIASMFLTPATQNQLAAGFDTLAATAGKSGGGASFNMSNPTAAVSGVLGTTLDAASKLWEGPVKPETAEQKGVIEGVLSGAAFGDLLGGLAAVLYRIFIAIFIVASGIIYLANMVISQIMINIALIVAPIFVPWILWESTSFLFHGWLKFMIIAGMQKVIGALLFGMTAAMVPAVTKIAEQAGATGSVNFYAYSAAFILVGLMAMMMVQVNSIANGLVSGSPRTGFSPPESMSPGGMASRSGGAITSAGRGAASGLNRGAGAAAGGAAGALSGGFKGMAQGISSGWSKGATSQARETAGKFTGFSKK